LDFAERQAEREQAMTMKDWAAHLDRKRKPQSGNGQGCYSPNQAMLHRKPDQRSRIANL